MGIGPAHCDGPNLHHLTPLPLYLVQQKPSATAHVSSFSTEFLWSSLALPKVKAF